MRTIDTRRAFLVALATAGTAVAAGCTAGAARLHRDPDTDERGEPDVGPAEDLMREHGVLNRILLVYEEAVRRVDAREPAPAAPLANAARIVQRFVEDYHERLEEEFLFPRFERTGRLVELVAVLRLQHERGRTLTARILDETTGARLRRAVVRPVRLFVRMYRPHEAREDTVLFPAFRRLVPEREYDALGERFEDEEHRRFGPRGFEAVVDEVAAIERELGIDDLGRFTPQR
jgi:hemerythrin-like domain-containing protein